VTDELSSTINLSYNGAESVCSDDSIWYSDVSAGEISLFTDFGDELCWSNIDDNLANLEQNDTVSTCTNTEQPTSSTEPSIMQPPNIQPPVNIIGYAIIGDNICIYVRM